MTYKFAIPQVTQRIETEEERIERDKVNAECAALAEESIRQWMEEHPGEDPFPAPPEGPEPEREYDPMDDYYRVKDNFRELGRIIDAANIAGCFITRQKVFWFVDAPANDNGHELIMTNRYFWPIFEEGTLISREAAMALVGEAMKNKQEPAPAKQKVAVAA